MVNKYWANLKFFVSEHLIAIFFALLVGTLCSLPQFLAIWSLGEQYKGIPFLYSDSEFVYLARIQEIFDGHLSASSHVFYEYKDSVSITPPSGEYFYFLGSKLLGISIIGFVYLSKLIFPAILFLLIYFLVLLLTKKIESECGLGQKLTAILAGLTSTIGYEFFNYRTLIPLLSGNTQNLNLNIWTRLINPITGAILLFLFFIFLLKIIEGKRKLIIPAGILLFLMIGYIFSFGISLLTCLILSIIFAVKKEYRIFKDLLSVILFSTIIFAVYIFISLMTNPYPTDSLRMGLFLTHTVLLNKLLLLVISFFAVSSLYFVKNKTFFKDERNNWWLFLLSVVLACFISYTQQVVTGMTVWPQHLVQYTIPISIITVLVLLFNFFSNNWRKIYIPFLIILIFSNVFMSLMSLLTYKNILIDFIDVQKYGEAVNWIKLNAEKDCVILSSDNRMNRIIPALTRCNVYLSDWVFSGVPMDRVRHNYFLYLRLKGITPDTIDSYLSENKEEVSNLFFRDWKDLFMDNNDPWLNKISNKKEIENWKEELNLDLASDFKKFMNNDLLEQIKKYRIDHVIINGADIGKYKELKLNLIEETGDFKIYKLN
ncbi:MAG: hypothetical protein UT05_C0002G0068 [Parcubacteria group bacterium GW2011_GWF2_38_76]|nr:MAG: hypothetical protein UT05_C0002G0068 [Parcubacteria group bacterium GW2011_GWF2_38_76]HBM45774.1 hypothetical protein [Patescibacteria group bacterium]